MFGVRWGMDLLSLQFSNHPERTATHHSILLKYSVSEPGRLIPPNVEKPESKNQFQNQGCRASRTRRAKAVLPLRGHWLRNPTRKQVSNVTRRFSFFNQHLHIQRPQDQRRHGQKSELSRLSTPRIQQAEGRSVAQRPASRVPKLQT